MGTVLFFLLASFAFSLNSTLIGQEEPKLPQEIGLIPLMVEAEKAPLQSPQISEISEPEKKSSVVPSTKPITPFTAKVTRNKVRLRTQPNVDSPIVKLLSRDDMLIVVAEADDFFAVLPSQELKGYVFRALILDNVVEAPRVNVRLEPNLDAPIISQLKAGDRVNGSVSVLNRKWLEITPPESTRLFVCKEFTQKIGDANMMSTIERRREEANTLLNSTYIASQHEMGKSFEDIRIDHAIANYNKVIQEYADFTIQASRAKELLIQLQESYLHKKVAHLEHKATLVPSAPAQPQVAKATPTQDKQATDKGEQTLTVLEKTPISAQKKTVATENPKKAVSVSLPPVVTTKMSAWIETENAYYAQWKIAHGEVPLRDLYQKEKESAKTLEGIIEPYTRVVKNKPGDYLLMDKNGDLPIAYLYSTQINLQEKVGHKVTLLAAPRPNYNFAFPAYFVLSVE